MKHIILSLSLLASTGCLAQSNIKIDGAAMVSFFKPSQVFNREPIAYEDLNFPEQNNQQVTSTGETVRSTPGFSISVEPYINRFIKLGLGFSTQSMNNVYEYDVRWKNQNNEDLRQLYRFRENYGLRQFMFRGLGTTRIGDYLILQGGFQFNYNTWSLYSEFPSDVKDSRILESTFGAGMVLSAGFYVSDGGQIMYEYTVGDIPGHKIGLRFRIL